MFTSSFWASDFADGLAYAASAYVSGGLLGKGLALGAEAANTTKIGAQMLKAFNAVGATGQRANLVTATMYNTISEAAAEAYQTQKELELIYQAQEYKPEEAKKKAAEGAAETFWWNTAALLFPNFVQNSFFHGNWNSKIDAVRKSVWANKGSANIKDLVPV